jgi:hypothetical protein
MAVAREADIPEVALEAEVPADIPANGPIRLALFLTKDGLCAGFCINACHAACDGRSMRNLTEKCLQKMSLSSLAIWQIPHRRPSLYQLIGEFCCSSQHRRLAKCDASPPFLPLPATAASLAELRVGDKSDGCDVRRDVSPSVVSSAITASREHQATITGLSGLGVWHERRARYTSSATANGSAALVSPCS